MDTLVNLLAFAVVVGCPAGLGAVLHSVLHRRPGIGGLIPSTERKV
jgi:hypothetical protein